MVAGAVSSVGRAVNAAADAAREAAGAANARVHDFVDGLSQRAANNNQAPQPPANDDSVSRSGGVPPGAPSGMPPTTPGDPTASPTGAGRETARAAGTLVNPADEI